MESLYQLDPNNWDMISSDNPISLANLIFSAIVSALPSARPMVRSVSAIA